MSHDLYKNCLMIDGESPENLYTRFKKLKVIKQHKLILPKESGATLHQHNEMLYRRWVDPRTGREMFDCAVEIEK